MAEIKEIDKDTTLLELDLEQLLVYAGEVLLDTHSLEVIDSIVLIRMMTLLGSELDKRTEKEFWFLKDMGEMH
tara:strand:- start:395 stop:613 length:219 start_codon:yes stop_codon:yes gene_type:complete